MDFRVVVSDPKSGKAYQVELKDPGAGKLSGENISATRSKEMSWACQATRCRLWAAVIAKDFPCAVTSPAQSAEKSCYQLEPDIILSPKERRRG